MPQVPELSVGKTAVGVGTGYYDGESAVGVSVAFAKEVTIGKFGKPGESRKLLHLDNFVPIHPAKTRCPCPKPDRLLMPMKLD